MQMIWLLVIWVNCGQPGLCPPGAVTYNIAPTFYVSIDQCEAAKRDAIAMRPPLTTRPRCHSIGEAQLQ